MPSNSSVPSGEVRSATEILEYLDDYYVHMIQRPTCYAASPAAMEGMIIFIEDLRAFILNRPEQANPYDQFLDSLGYEATGCSHRDGSTDMLTDDDVMLFKRVADVLKQFLTKHERKTEAENGPALDNREKKTGHH